MQFLHAWRVPYQYGQFVSHGRGPRSTAREHKETGHARQDVSGFRFPREKACRELVFALAVT